MLPFLACSFDGPFDVEVPRPVLVFFVGVMVHHDPRYALGESFGASFLRLLATYGNLIRSIAGLI